MMRPVLLDEFPAITWWGGIGVTVMMAVFSWLFRTVIQALKEKIERLEHSEEVQDRDIREIRQNINDQHISILKEINAVGIKIAEFQREMVKK